MSHEERVSPTRLFSDAVQNLERAFREASSNAASNSPFEPLSAHAAFRSPGERLNRRDGITSREERLIGRADYLATSFLCIVLLPQCCKANRLRSSKMTRIHLIRTIDLLR